MKGTVVLGFVCLVLFIAFDAYPCGLIVDVMPQLDNTPTINCGKNGSLPITLLFACSSSGNCSNVGTVNLEGVAPLRCKPDDLNGDGAVTDFTCHWRVSDVCPTQVCDGTIIVCTTNLGCGADSNYQTKGCPD